MCQAARPVALGSALLPPDAAQTVGAARFALENDARWLALTVTEANAPARALYEGAGMETVARYHYRQAK